MRLPPRINRVFTKMFRIISADMMERAGYDPIPDWDIYCCDVKRGFCKPESKVITIPLWTTGESPNHGTPNDLWGKSMVWVYYIAHELAHAVADTVKHGPEFYEAFRRLCPEELQHYELGYKPRNAKAAGIKFKERQGTNMLRGK